MANSGSEGVADSLKNREALPKEPIRFAQLPSFDENGAARVERASHQVQRRIERRGGFSSVELLLGFFEAAAFSVDQCEFQVEQDLLFNRSILPCDGNPFFKCFDCSSHLLPRLQNTPKDPLGSRVDGLVVT